MTVFAIKTRYHVESMVHCLIELLCTVAGFTAWSIWLLLTWTVATAGMLAWIACACCGIAAAVMLFKLLSWTCILIMCGTMVISPVLVFADRIGWLWASGITFVGIAGVNIVIGGDDGTWITGFAIVACVLWVVGLLLRDMYTFMDKKL